MPDASLRPQPLHLLLSHAAWLLPSLLRGIIFGILHLCMGVMVTQARSFAAGAVGGALCQASRQAQSKDAHPQQPSASLNTTIAAVTPPAGRAHLNFALHQPSGLRTQRLPAGYNRAGSISAVR